MTRIKKILEEIDHLTPVEMELILNEIKKRVQKQKDIKSTLEKYRGIGKGVWQKDAQEYINFERSNDRT